MYQSTKPADIYRRVELDARVEGSDGIGLTRLCLDEAISELGRAHSAYTQRNMAACRDALTRASSGLAALHRGVASDNPLREPLLHLYGSAERAVRAAVIRYEAETMARVQLDLRDIRAILASDQLPRSE